MLFSLIFTGIKKGIIMSIERITKQYLFQLHSYLKLTIFCRTGSDPRTNRPVRLIFALKHALVVQDNDTEVPNPTRFPLYKKEK